MSKTRCKGFRRHYWRRDKICARCTKARNPAAGDKMFRPRPERKE